MTTSKLDQAREWAESVGEIEGLSPRTYATIKLIQSLPDRIVDGDKLRQVIDFQGTSISGYARKDLESLIPAPSPRTLGDMSFDELKEYIGEKVVVDGWANPTRLVAVIDDEGAVLAHRFNKPWPYVEVRPLSDLAPVAAPEQETESTPEPAQPRPEDVPPGEPWSIRYYGKEWAGVRSDSEWVPWSIISMDGQDYRDVDDSEIALMFRLIPENKENA